MKVKVLKGFWDRCLARHPGEIIEVSPETAEQLIESGLAKAVKSRKRKEPSEDKALRPSENKGANDEGESA